MTYEEERDAKNIQALRDMADLVEANPGMFSHVDATIAAFPEDEQEARVAVAALGGDRKKRQGPSGMIVERLFGSNRFAARVFMSESGTCEKKIVGTRTVTVPDPTLLAEVPMVEIEEPVEEWVCPESIMGGR